MPRGERRFKYTDGLGHLSGYGYLRALAHEDNLPVRLIYAHPKNCDHVASICDTPSCVDSWQIDHTIQFERTARGRLVIGRLGDQHDKRKNPSHMAHPVDG